MHKLILLFILLATRPVMAKEAPKVISIKNQTVGKWINIHQERDDLLGVHIQQFPDNSHDANEYEGKHPAMIIYVFKSLQAHQVEYNPDGSIFNGFWWKLKPDHHLLKQIRPVSANDKKS